jgi:hypothetical protein
MILTLPINNIPAMASGGLVTFTLPIGVRHHGFSLFLTSNGSATAANSTTVSRVYVNIDSTLLINWSWTSVYNYYTRKNYSATTGEIPIFFTDPALAGLRNWAAGSIDAKQNISSIQVQVQLGTISTPGMTGAYHFDNVPNRRRAPGWTKANPVWNYFNTPIKKYEQVENLPASGAYDITDVAPTYPLDTLTLFGIGGNITASTLLQLDTVPVFQGTPSAIAQRILQYGIITPTGTIVIPFTYDRQSPRSAARFSTIDWNVTNASTAAIAAGLTVELQLPTI